MQRNYNNTTSETVQRFVGTEVEHSPAFGHKTLFVVGVQPVDEIIADAIAHQCTHIYFGANQSFPAYLSESLDDMATWDLWSRMVLKTLCHSAKFLCTLDLDVSMANWLSDSDLIKQPNFIPMISVKLPWIRELPYSTTIKFDDVDFAYSNPGVWCHNLSELQTRATFTDWSKYTQDTVIK